MLPELDEGAETFSLLKEGMGTLSHEGVTVARLNKLLSVSVSVFIFFRWRIQNVAHVLQLLFGLSLVFTDSIYASVTRSVHNHFLI